MSVAVQGNEWEPMFGTYKLISTVCLCSMSVVSMQWFDPDRQTLSASVSSVSVPSSVQIWIRPQNRRCCVHSTLYLVVILQGLRQCVRRKINVFSNDETTVCQLLRDLQHMHARCPGLAYRSTPLAVRGKNHAQRERWSPEGNECDRDSLCAIKRRWQSLYLHAACEVKAATLTPLNSDWRGPYLRYARLTA